MRTSLRFGITGIVACAMSVVAAPAFAAPGPSNGTQEMQLTCDGSPVTVLTRANTSHADQNWAAAYIVDSGTIVPVSFAFSLYDDTVQRSLGDFTAAHPNAHHQQQTMTCTSSEQGLLSEFGPGPGGSFPENTSPTDVVTFTITVVAALPGSGK